MTIYNKKKKTLGFLLVLLLFCTTFASILAITIAHRPSKENPTQKIKKTISPAIEENTKTNPPITDASANNLTAEINLIINNMSLADKVSQLFFITPESLTGVEPTTTAGEITKQAFDTYPVGGIIYFSSNIESQEQLLSMTESYQAISKSRLSIPLFIGIDEEGGSVTRIGGHGLIDVPPVDSMLSIGNTGNPQNAYNVGSTIGTYLSASGFNVDFAPISDVLTNPNNLAIGDRSFGSDPMLVASMVEQTVSGLQDNGISATLKHFPGHGDTLEDSHSGFAYSYKTIEELRLCEFIPFKQGIDADVDFVMVGHISVPNITGDSTPSSLSKRMVTDILRTELNYSGIIITDALNMGAISNNYSSAEIALQAINAGIDMLLMPADFAETHREIMNAVETGTFSEERLNESLHRILSVKLQHLKLQTHTSP